MRAISPFLERLQRGPILSDGGMGTQIYARGVTFDRCFEQLNLTDAELIKAIHLDYIAAGAEVIETNTFGANRYRLREHGLENAVHKMNRAGARIAREAREISDKHVFLAGCIGPPGVRLAPLGEVKPIEAQAAFREQAEALLESGVDLLMLETISYLGEMREALQAIRSITDVPIVALMTFGEDTTLVSGEEPLTAARVMRDLGADIVGINCASGPAGTLSALEKMASGNADHFLLAVQPNAGLPRRVGNRFIYDSTPSSFADYTRRFLNAGARLVGGCCGTTPQHIAAMSKVLNEFSPDLQPAQKTVKSAVRLEVVHIDEREKQGHLKKV